MMNYVQHRDFPIANWGVAVHEMNEADPLHETHKLTLAPCGNVSMVLLEVEEGSRCEDIARTFLGAPEFMGGRA